MWNGSVNILGHRQWISVISGRVTGSVALPTKFPFEFSLRNGDQSQPWRCIIGWSKCKKQVDFSVAKGR